MSSPPADRKATLQLAQSELAAGRRTEAKRLLAAAADRFGSVEALLQLSRLQSEDGDAAGALDSLRKARAAAPNSEECSAHRASVAGRGRPGARNPRPRFADAHLSNRGTTSLPARGRVDARGRHASGGRGAARAERLEPNRPLTLLALGIALNAGQLYADAKPFLTRSVALEPEDVNVVAALAEAEQGLGELDAAAAHAQRALSKAPNHATANLVTGLIAMDQARYPEARAALERAVAADPQSPRAHYQLSLACAGWGTRRPRRRRMKKYKETLRNLEGRGSMPFVPATGPLRTAPKGPDSKQPEKQDR